MQKEMSQAEIDAKFDRTLLSGSKTGHAHLSLRNGHYKIIRGSFQDSSNKLEIFDITNDKTERKNLAGSQPEILQQYLAMLDTEIRTFRKVAAILKESAGPQGDRIEFTDKMKDDLKALGYVE